MKTPFFTKAIFPIVLGAILTPTLQEHIEITITCFIILLALSIKWRLPLFILLFIIPSITPLLNKKDQQLSSKIYLVEQIKSKKNFQQVLCGQIQSNSKTYLNITDTSLSIKNRDTILCWKELQPIRAFSDAHQDYLNRSNITHQVFLDSHEIIVLPCDSNLTLKWTNYLSNSLPLSSGLNIALLTGNKTYLDKYTKEIFRSLGINHILAISGLHLGIIYLLIAGLFKVYPHPKTKILRIITSCSVIWFYTYLLDFPTSITRAAIMLSLYLINELIQNKSNTFNQFCATACIILIINPSMIYNLGFQLSFSAVLGILLIYPKLKEKIHSRYWMINFILQSINLSLSAQLLTLPLVIFYFQSYNFFNLISNLIYIPLITIQLYTALLHLVSYYFTYIQEFTANICEYSYKIIEWTNHNTTLIGRLESQDITIDLSETIILYLIAFLIAIPITSRLRVYGLFIASISFVCYGNYQLWIALQNA